MKRTRKNKKKNYIANAHTRKTETEATTWVGRHENNAEWKTDEQKMEIKRINDKSKQKHWQRKRTEKNAGIINVIYTSQVDLICKNG